MMMFNRRLVFLLTCLMVIMFLFSGCKSKDGINSDGRISLRQLSGKESTLLDKIGIADYYSYDINVEGGQEKVMTTKFFLEFYEKGQLVERVPLGVLGFSTNQKDLKAEISFYRTEITDWQNSNTSKDYWKVMTEIKRPDQHNTSSTALFDITQDGRWVQHRTLNKGHININEEIVLGTWISGKGNMSADEVELTNKALNGDKEALEDVKNKYKVTFLKFMVGNKYED